MRMIFDKMKQIPLVEVQAMKKIRKMLKSTILSVFLWNIVKSFDIVIQYQRLWH